MSKHFLLTAAAMAALSSVTLAESQQDQSQIQGQAQAQAAGGQFKSPTQQYLSDMSSANLLEVQLGQLVDQKVQDQQIKQLAQITSRDHKQANVQLQQVAQKIGQSVPQQLNPVDQATLNYFSQLPPDQLQRQYVFYQVASHDKNLLTNQYEANNAQDPQIRQFAQQMAAKLQQHLQHAQQLAQAQINAGQAQPAGGHMMPGMEGGEQHQK